MHEFPVLSDPTSQKVDNLVQAPIGICLGTTTRPKRFMGLLLAILLLAFLPVVSATPDHDPFPDVTFQVFSDFILSQFGSHVSLATVLTILFTMTSNPDLLNLHARQQHPKVSGEVRQGNSGWIKALAHALENRLGEITDSLFCGSEHQSGLSAEQVTNAIGTKLDGLSKVLGRYPYSREGRPLQKLKPVSDQEIEPVVLICPQSMECETAACQSRAILRQTRDRDISRATLVKGTKIYDGVPVLAGYCGKCQAVYHADHERAKGADGTWMKLYLNSAKYLKVGQNIWVDRAFSGAVLNGFYHFHASTSAFVEFWNQSFWKIQQTSSRKISRRQVWQAFVQESVRKLAAVSAFDLELPDRLPIGEVTIEAFKVLGEEGVIRSANNHQCSECTHVYKRMADTIVDIDPAGLVGMDENRNVPEFTGENNDEMDTEDGENVGEASSGDEEMDIDSPDHNSSSSDEADQVAGDQKEETLMHMAVMDGIVMGPKRCAYNDCVAGVANNRDGVFCAEHEALRGHLCRVRDCPNPKIAGSQACNQHREHWYSHVTCYTRSTLLGVQRMLKRTAVENLPWAPGNPHTIQPHDEEPAAVPQTRNYFSTNRFYCIETICAPCGVVIAWTKFAKAESPSNILDFLDKVYPTADSRPDYICIDKACLVLRHAIASGRWNIWKNTTRFIVDSYHYINHRNTDYMCRKYCNPAPLNGSAPNLVVVEHDRLGHPHYKRAFNTQACEQLNAWIGGFDTIVKKMNIGNFDWFIHVMLFLHTLWVIDKQMEKRMRSGMDVADEKEDEDEDEEDGY